MELRLDLRAARRLAIQAQLLAGPRPPATAEGLLEVARRLRCIQLDAVGVAGAQTHFLVPFSRIGPYRRELLDRLQFEDKALFHYFAHAASLVLTEDFPIHAGAMRRYADRTDLWGSRIHGWMEENRALRDLVLEQIAARGPQRSRDFDSSLRTDWRSSAWAEGRSVNRMLEFLWVEGSLTVAGRVGQERLWELSERWFPDWTPRRRLTPAERSDEAVAHALRALGVATSRQVDVHFLRRSLRTRYPDLAGSLARLTASGEVLPATVEGAGGRWYLHRDSLPLLEAPWRPRTVLLSPFDNLVADRERTLRLFGFDYRIEIYVPPAKRRRGYYAMPVLAGDAIIGTVDPSFDRATGVLTVKRVALEPGARFTSAARAAVAELGRFVGATAVEYTDR